ncbi:MAG TPA: TIGR04211 family SH3 domain-containing protein [Desulfobacteraceae bacterium]|nr:TIGR04211 family SH3 domain-containing protein [Deltaproteobacteria bacterium]HDI60597.1 TIGR04211 family SH3 domain-containing protein [Desulfobacteraceae bacterium]
MKLMTRLCLIVSVALLMQGLGSALAAAATMYVSDEIEITMRTGPATDRKIIALLSSGSAVEMVERGKDWSRVRLSDGREGWVLTRYLTADTPTAIKLEQLETRYAEVVERNKELERKVSKLSTENSATGSELAQAQAELNRVKAAYETLKSESTDFLKLKAKYEKNVKELKEARQAAEKFENERNRLAHSQLMDGLLYGGGLVIFGFIAGWIIKRPRQRSGLL